MTRLQLDYAQYMENRRHSQAVEDISRQELAETIKSHRNSEAVANRNATTAERTAKSQIEYTSAQIKQAENSIALSNKEFNLKRSQTNWQQQMDKFNAGLRAQELALKKDTLALDKDKFANGKTQFWKDYDLKRGQYNLAVKEFKANKNSQTWNNVLNTSKELRNWLSPGVNALVRAAGTVLRSRNK